MVTDEEIKKLAYSIWEQEGRPDGKDVEHYLRAKKILEEQEEKRVFELAPQTPVTELAPPPQQVQLPPPPGKRNRRTRHKKK